MLRLSPSPNVRAAPLVAMSQPFFCILNTMHKILPANGKITDCLIKERSFFSSHRLLQTAQFFMRFMRTRLISQVAYRCVLHVWYSLSAYFHHSPYTCQRTRDGVQTCLVPDAFASGSRHARIWEQRRLRLGPRTGPTHYSMASI